jgi:hypothetical protein
MTKAEATVFFPEPDDVENQLDEHLFGFKQFFLTKPILSATFQSRIATIEKINEAAIVLGIPLRSEVQIDFQKVAFTAIVVDALEHYFQLKSSLKLAISQARTPQSLLSSVRELINVHQEFCALWVYEFSEEDGVLLSKPFDEVEFVQSIHRCNERGLVTFEDLKKANLSNEPMLLKEMKRLSLQHKKEQEWMNASKN